MQIMSMNRVNTTSSHTLPSYFSDVSTEAASGKVQSAKVQSIIFMKKVTKDGQHGTDLIHSIPFRNVIYCVCTSTPAEQDNVNVITSQIGIFDFDDHFGVAIGLEAMNEHSFACFL